MTSDLILEVTGGFRDDFLSERDILVRRRLVNAVPLLQRNAPAVQATRAYTSKLAARRVYGTVANGRRLRLEVLGQKVMQPAFGDSRTVTELLFAAPEVLESDND
ncbi:hypothetical protein PPTG_22868 [Phytophthora nicotianae INRA-310]|uniref:Uncharacterized protein n=1 Tax=Phytophthora nicotianae (strain INRA-310) TaxID=761204 RepID=W2Q9X5_PHYN3|nr:hypothetical protein PPTG_22868 [Phytophthora nicotianae INRA-310]ETN09329.1 hypothetical protein PPTG_22868 [Phytophthora nicotianae INRA-310]